MRTSRNLFLCCFALRKALGFTGLGFGPCRRFGATAVPERRFGGFLARFLGHTPSFRRFRRLNHCGIAGRVRQTGKGAFCGASLTTPERGYKEFDASRLAVLK